MRTSVRYLAYPDAMGLNIMIPLTLSNNTRFGFEPLEWRGAVPREVA